ncbi:uncharacterized protein LOC144159942 [Haemaphysalis longicornis]
MDGLPASAALSVSQMEADMEAETAMSAQQHGLRDIDGKSCVFVTGEDLAPDDTAGWVLPSGKRARNNIKNVESGTVKGVIKGISVTDTQEDINANIVNMYNPQALQAHRIGTSTAVIILFEGTKVPNYVKYGAVLHGCDHTLVELHARDIGHSKNVFILNVYCRPGAKHKYDFDAILKDAMGLAKSRTLLVMGDFNAPHPMWGYKIASKRGKALVQAMGKHGLYLINEPGIPTRTGNSVTNDTTPDLTWSSGPLETRWKCDDADLGSDHKIIKIDVLGPQYKAVYGKAWITDWDKMRNRTSERKQEEDAEPSAESYEDWARRQQTTLQKWKRQRRNSKLARRIGLLNKEIAAYAAKLCRENWHKMCEGLQGQLSAGKTWKVLRHLIDPAQGKSTMNRNLTKDINNYDGDSAELLRDLQKRYLQTEKGRYLPPQVYEGTPNEELDRLFTISELWAAIDKSNRKSAPGADNITYKLLFNMCSRTANELLQHINEAWETSRLPQEWKTAKRHLEETGQMPATMFGFRKHLGTQDVMVQLHELVIKQATRSSPRAILALDLKGAFDNVTHASILRNLNGTGCGTRTFHYVRNFLEDRAAVLTIGLDHAFYADDITVWTNRAGSEGWMEETLQRAATTVHEYAKSCGLSCAPQKSELLVVQPGVGKRSRCGLKIEIDGIQVEPTQQCRILGLLLRSDGKADAVVDKICLTSEQDLGMLRRVAKKNRGIKENDALRLVHAFVVTRTTYSAPYLNLTGTQKAKLDVILRKATKQALGLPAYTSTKRLCEMGVHNTVDKLVEAHLSNQRMRLSGSEHGRRILEKIGWRPEPVQTSGRVPEHWRDKINTKPLPRNMAPGEDDDRRKARAKALETCLEGNPNVMYVDAALVKGSDKAALAVTTRDRLVAVASTRTRNATNAEEMAIALALIQPGATHVVTDSKKAYANYRGGLMSSEAARVLKRHKTPDNEVELIWTPAHSSLVGNNIADYYARDMSCREVEETGAVRRRWELPLAPPSPSPCPHMWFGMVERKWRMQHHSDRMWMPPQQLLAQRALRDHASCGP